MKTALLSILAMVLAPVFAHAGVLPSITGRVKTSNYTGYLILADQITGHAPGRSKISGEWTMSFDWDGEDNIGAQYESVIWFQDEEGNKLPIVPDGGGAAVTEITEEYQVLLTSGMQQDTHTFAATFRPQNPLSPQKSYSVRAKFRGKAGGENYPNTYLLVPLNSSEVSTRQYFDFNNTASGDSDINVQISADPVTWPRPWMIAGSGTQGTMAVATTLNIRRFDGFDTPAAVDSCTATLSIALKNEAGATVWTAPDHDVFFSIPSHAGGTGAAADPAATSVTTTTNLSVPAGVLVPGQVYTSAVTVSHTGEVTRSGVDGTREFGAQRLLRLSSRLYFGSVQATFDQLYNSPSEALFPDATPLPTSTLYVTAGHGFLPGVASTTFGGLGLEVQIEPDGDAVYIGVNPVPVSAPATVTVQGTPVTRTGITLSTSGAVAGSISARLPRGMGWSPTPGTRVLKKKISNSNVTLNASLEPIGVVLGGGLYVSLERLPLVFASNTLAFNYATGVFTFTPGSATYNQAFELAALEAFFYASPSLLDWPLDKLLHAGNDQVFRLAKTTLTSFNVKTGSDGAAFIQAAQVGFNAGAFFTHYPYGIPFYCTAPGVDDALFVISNDKVASTSKLAGLTTTLLPFTPDAKPDDSKSCPTGTPALGRQFLTVQPLDGEMSFLPDGSLNGVWNILPLSGPQIGWGTVSASPAQVVHRAGMGYGTLLVPSHFLPWRTSGQSAPDPAQAGISAEQRTGVLHLAGRGGEAPTGWEYPHQLVYEQGKADYAGLNLRVGAQGGDVSAVSIIGGTTTPGYTVHPASKLYVRESGVSGRFQSTGAMDLVVGGNDEQYGLALHLDRLRLSYLSNDVIDSLSPGGLEVGVMAADYASRFTLNFTGLKLKGNGALDKGEVATGQLPKPLQYWKTEVSPLTMSFAQPDPCLGPGSPTFLALGVDAALPSLAQGQTLKGVLGFRCGNGSLVARADVDNDFDVTGLDSRFYMPGNVYLRGAGSSRFSMIPVSGAYLNRWTPAPVPSSGFVNLLGAIDVPFFENLPAHLQTSASSAADVQPAISVMGPPAELGPFDKVLFDPQNLGVPQGIPLAQYTTPGSYPLNAQKNWLGLLNFEYPLKWNSSQRGFESATNFGADLVVVSADSKVRSLSPSQADITFKASIGPSPALSTSQLMGQVLDGLDISSSVLLQKLEAAMPGGASLSSAFGQIARFEEALADTPEKLIRTPLTDAITPLLAAHSPGTDAAGLINALSASLAASFDNDSSGWKGQVGSRLDDVTAAVATLKTVSGNATTVLNLANAAASALGGTPAVSPPQEVLDSLAKIHDALNRVSADIGTVRSGVNALSLGLNAAGWSALLTPATNDLQALALTGLSQAQQAEAVANALLDRLLGSSEIAGLSERMREHVSALRDDVRSSVDSVLGTMNELTSSASGDLSAVPGMPELSIGKVQGYARINGDSLHELRLDVATDLSAIGSPISFTGYVLYRDLQSDTPGNASRFEAGVASEITLGAATSFSFGAPPAPTKLEVEAKFAFDNAGSLNGLAGRFGLAGAGFRLGPLTIKQAELGFGFGAGDAYLYGLGKGASDYFDLEAAVFVGTASNPMEVLGRIDPLVVELATSPSVAAHVNLQNPPGPVFGLYAFGYGAISINALIGIPPSCMLNLKAGAGFGAFAFTYKDSSGYDGIIGLRNDFGISGEVLCLADISARVSIVGAAAFADRENILDVFTSAPQNISGIGKASFEAEIGVDPFSVSVSKTLKVNFSYSPPGSTSYGVDF